MIFGFLISLVCARIIAEAETRLGIRQAREEAEGKPEGFNPFCPDEPSAVIEEKSADESPANSLPKPESKSSSKSKSSRSYCDYTSAALLLTPYAVFTRWADKSRGLLRKGSVYLHPFVCYSSKAHDPLD